MAKVVSLLFIFCTTVLSSPPVTHLESPDAMNNEAEILESFLSVKDRNGPPVLTIENQEVVGQRSDPLAQALQENEDLRARCHQLEEECTRLAAHLEHLHNRKILKLRTLLQRPWSLAKFGELTRLLAQFALQVPMKHLAARTHRLWGSNDTSAKSRRVVQKRWRPGAPLVSVIVPCFNYGRFLGEAIDSTLRQTFANFEILLVDCSTEADSISVVEKISHPKIRKFRRKGQHLLGDNRNFGIRHARGKYVCSLDPDDTLEPTYLEKAVFLLEYCGFDVVGPSVRIFGESTGSWFPPETPTISALLYENCIPVVSVYNKKVWDQARGFHDYGLGAEHVHEDWDFWVRAMALGARVHTVQEQLFNYRKHSGSMSAHPAVPNKELQRQKLLTYNRRVVTPKAIARSNHVQFTGTEVTNPLINLLNDKRLKATNEEAHAKRTVLFALPYLVLGGGEKRFQEIGQWLTSNGYEVIVVTTEAPGERLVDVTERFQKVTPHIFHLPRFLSDHSLYAPFIHYLIRSRAIGTILLGGSSFFYDLVQELKDAHPDIRIVDQQFNTSVHFVSNRRFAKYIDHTIAENDTIYEEICNVHGESSEKVSLVHNGVDVHGRFAPRPRPEILPHPIPQHAVVVSFIGRLSEEKGPDLFIEIARALAHNPSLFFVLAGPGPMSESLVEAARRYSLSERISFSGMVDTADYLSFTDILVVPSRIDGRPNVVLEAISMGVPVVASEVGGLPSLVKKGETGLLCASGNVAQFVEAIGTLAENVRERDKLRRSARAFALRELDLDRCKACYLEIFERLSHRALRKTGPHSPA